MRNEKSLHHSRTFLNISRFSQPEQKWTNAPKISSLCRYDYVFLPEILIVYINLNFYFHKPYIKSSSPFEERKIYKIFLSLNLLESYILWNCCRLKCLQQMINAEIFVSCFLLIIHSGVYFLFNDAVNFKN